jgi:hypothetical protein
VVESLNLSWHERVSLSAGDGGATVSGPGARLSLRPVAPEILAALQRLAPPGESEAILEDAILAEGDVQSLARWHFHIDQFRRRGLIRRTLHAENRPLVTLVPLCPSVPTSWPGPRAVINGRRPWPDEEAFQAFSLSRFAYLRNESGEMVLESPLSRSRLVLHHPLAMSVIGALASPSTLVEVCNQVPTLMPATIRRLMGLLQDAAMIDATPVDGSAAGSNATDEGLESWEFHDLLFHSCSRRGRTDAEFGATYRFTDQPPPPVLKPIPAGSA